jgi:peptidoglycan hydrolase-like protein with peptidoglycan-binding domain
MKLKHIITASVASAFLGAAAFAQQSPNGMQSPKASDAMQQGNHAMQSDQSTQAGSSMHENKMAAPPHSSMNGNASNAVIRQAQEKLNAKGYNAGPVDGVWGPKTRAALENFQKAKDITQTGVIDQKTMAALDINGQQTAGSKTRSMQKSGGAASEMMKRKEQG